MSATRFTMHSVTAFAAWVGIGLIGSACCFANSATQEASVNSIAEESIAEKQIIGPVMILAETESELEFRARVDTGATSTSIHVEEFKIENESPNMQENVGKKIRFRLKNHRGESEWLERKIKSAITVKTSAKEQNRYKVPLELRLNDITKEVDVTLNDRSHMTYELLLGRNFLRKDFLVDVDLPQNESAVVQVSAIETLALENSEESTNEESESSTTDEAGG